MFTVTIFNDVSAKLSIEVDPGGALRTRLREMTDDQLLKFGKTDAQPRLPATLRRRPQALRVDVLDSVGGGQGGGAATQSAGK